MDKYIANRNMTVDKAFELMKELEIELRLLNFAEKDIYTLLFFFCDMAADEYWQEAMIWFSVKKAIMKSYKKEQW